MVVLPEGEKRPERRDMAFGCREIGLGEGNEGEVGMGFHGANGVVEFLSNGKDFLPCGLGFLPFLLGNGDLTKTDQSADAGAGFV